MDQADVSAFLVFMEFAPGIDWLPQLCLFNGCFLPLQVLQLLSAHLLISFALELKNHLLQNAELLLASKTAFLSRCRTIAFLKLPAQTSRSESVFFGK